MGDPREGGLSGDGELGRQWTLLKLAEREGLKKNRGIIVKPGEWLEASGYITRAFSDLFCSKKAML